MQTTETVGRRCVQCNVKQTLASQNKRFEYNSYYLTLCQGTYVFVVPAYRTTGQSLPVPERDPGPTNTLAACRIAVYIGYLHSVFVSMLAALSLAALKHSCLPMLPLVSCMPHTETSLSAVTAC